MINFREKAHLFAEYFSVQCKPFFDESVLLSFIYLSEHKLDKIAISYEEIVSLSRNLNKAKYCGPDNISAHSL